MRPITDNPRTHNGGQSNLTHLKTLPSQNSRQYRLGGKTRALDGGPLMSPVVFKKWQCPQSLLFKIFLSIFKVAQYRLSILRNDNVPCRYLSNVPVDLKVA